MDNRRGILSLLLAVTLIVSLLAPLALAQAPADLPSLRVHYQNEDNAYEGLASGSGAMW